MSHMTEKEWSKFNQCLIDIINYFGSPLELAKFLNTSRMNIYTWKSRTNLNKSTNEPIRKIPIRHVLKIEKKMKKPIRQLLRPDIYK